MILTNIKQIELKANYIKDFNVLKKYKDTLEIIELNKNDISDISYLSEFVKECKKLTKISLKGNKIDLNNEYNKKIITHTKQKVLI